MLLNLVNITMFMQARLMCPARYLAFKAATSGYFGEQYVLPQESIINLKRLGTVLLMSCIASVMSGAGFRGTSDLFMGLSITAAFCMSFFTYFNEASKRSTALMFGNHGEQAGQVYIADQDGRQHGADGYQETLANSVYLQAAGDPVEAEPGCLSRCMGFFRPSPLADQEMGEL